MTRWEHKIAMWEESPYEGDDEMYRRMEEKSLDRRGDQGWELVDIRYHSDLDPPMVRTIWKRPKQ